MPVTRSRTYNADMEDSHNTTGFLFGDEDSQPSEGRPAAQTNASDGFPTLLRQQGFPGHLVSFSFPSRAIETRMQRLNHALCIRPSYAFCFWVSSISVFHSLIMTAPLIILTPNLRGISGSKSILSTFLYDSQHQCSRAYREDIATSP